MRRMDFDSRMKGYRVLKNILGMLVAIFSVITVTVEDCAAADRPGTNSDESKVRPYTLPDPLTFNDGTKVTDAKTWVEKRRPELLDLFRANMHGHSPAKPAVMKFEVESTDAKALNGLATRKEIAIYPTGSKDGPAIHLLLYIPNGAQKPSPAFIGVNFDGNHTICPEDTGVVVREQWMWNKATKTDALVKPEIKKTLPAAIGWPVEMVLKRGYAVATIARADVEPDYPEGWKHGIRGYYLKQAGRTEFAQDDWGAIAAWGWSLSRALDYLETDAAIDAKHVAVLGHSRMGKASLWAGASDERFALVISNDSGEGGAAIARRWFGETTAVINQNFPHWFCANFKQYAGNEAKLPFDAHELLALVAPRPLYVASAEEDLWADPRGEFLAAKHASVVYTLFDKKGITEDDMPAIHHPVGDTVAYHIRAGKHDMTAYDWEQYVAFADRQFKN